MATGDNADMLARVRSLLPPWFPDQGEAPAIDAVLTGIAALAAFAYSLLQYAITQSRIATAEGGWLDLIAWDYLGARFLRQKPESDEAFRLRILAELLRARLTRAGIAKAIEDVTGTVPRIIEAWSPADNGIWDSSVGRGLCFYDIDSPAHAFRWSDTGLKCAFFVEVVLPPGVSLGVNAAPAFDKWTMAYDAFGAFIDLTPVPTGQRVYDAINASRAAGVTVWVKFVPAQTNPYWDQPGATWDQPGAVWH